MHRIPHLEDGGLALRACGGPGPRLVRKVNRRMFSPQWGADGLIIGGALAPSYGGMAGPDSDAAGAGDLRTAKSRLGLSYEALPGIGGKSLLGSKEAKLKEVRVFYCPEIAKLY